MGLALNEIEREARAIEFYEVLSSFDFMRLDADAVQLGTKHSQLSSCYLSTVGDDLDRIYEAIRNATGEVRGRARQRLDAGARARQPPREPTERARAWCHSSKVVNDTAVAVNQGGKRKGRCAAISKRGIWTSKSFSSCARTPVTIAGARTT